MTQVCFGNLFLLPGKFNSLSHLIKSKPTLKTRLKTPSQANVCSSNVKKTLLLGWLFLLITWKANSGKKKMLWVHQTIYSPSWEQGKTSPTLLAEESLWLVVVKEISTDNIGPKSQPLTHISCDFCSKTCSLIPSPFVIYRFESEEQWRTPGSKGLTESTSCRNVLFHVKLMRWCGNYIE